MADLLFAFQSSRIFQEKRQELQKCREGMIYGFSGAVKRVRGGSVVGVQG
jgi:hypothetical protein